MAEYIGLIASLISLAELSFKAAERVNDYLSNDAPKSFKQVQSQLPVMIATLRNIHAKLKDGTYLAGDIGDISPVLNECDKELSKLKATLDSCLPKHEASQWRRAWLGLYSMQQEKKVEKRLSNVAKLFQTLTVYEIHRPKIDAGQIMNGVVESPKCVSKCLHMGLLTWNRTDQESIGTIIKNQIDQVLSSSNIAQPSAIKIEGHGPALNHGNQGYVTVNIEIVIGSTLRSDVSPETTNIEPPPHSYQEMKSVFLRIKADSDPASVRRILCPPSMDSIEFLQRASTILKIEGRSIQTKLELIALSAKSKAEAAASSSMLADEDSRQIRRKTTSHIIHHAETIFNSDATQSGKNTLIHIGSDTFWYLEPTDIAHHFRTILLLDLVPIVLTLIFLYLNPPPHFSYWYPDSTSCARFKLCGNDARKAALTSLIPDIHDFLILWYVAIYSLLTFTWFRNWSLVDSGTGPYRLIPNPIQNEAIRRVIHTLPVELVMFFFLVMDKVQELALTAYTLVLPSRRRRLTTEELWVKLRSLGVYALAGFAYYSVLVYAYRFEGLLGSFASVLFTILLWVFGTVALKRTWDG
jgi:hypothetical protein